jgi:hypothetical protein
VTPVVFVMTDAQDVAVAREMRIPHAVGAAAVSWAGRPVRLVVIPRGSARGRAEAACTAGALLAAGAHDVRLLELHPGAEHDLGLGAIVALADGADERAQLRATLLRAVSLCQPIREAS